MKRLFVTLAVAIAVICAAVFGYSEYQQRKQFKGKLQEAIGRDSGFTETILKIEQDSSQMTYGEVFELCDKSIEGRNALIVDLRGLYPTFKTDLKDKLIAFLNVENDVARAKRDLYRKRLKVSSSFDVYKDSVNDTPSSYYGYDFYWKHVTKAREELAQSLTDVEASANEFDDMYSKALKLEPEVQAAAYALGLQYEPIFKKHEPLNKKTTQETFKLSKDYRTWLKLN